MYRVIICIIFLCIQSTGYATENNYICPMHPHIQGKEGSVCPICGMSLVPFEKENNHSKYIDTEASITVPSYLIQTSGIKITEVANVEFGQTIRAFANIVPNERKQTRITSRAAGWISDLTISAIGDNVKEGQEIFKIHSPDMVIAQSDYLIDIKRGRPSSFRTHYRLFEHFKIDQIVVNQIKKTGNPLRDIPYFSEYSGTVSELNIKVGSYVTVNSLIAILNDYSSLWIHVNIAEKDMPYINAESLVTVSLPNNPSLKFEAGIDYIHPTLDNTSRTGLVRLQLDNKEGLFRPGQYVDVVFENNVKPRLAVPLEAILRDSQGAHVILSKGNGLFAPQKIKIGISNSNYTEVTAGLKIGDKVVTSSQFLIDAESSLRESLKKLSDSNFEGDPHAHH